MKTIKLTIAMALMVLGSYSANAQKKEAVLLADETTMTELAASVKIQTSNAKIFGLLTSKFGSIIKGYSVKIKKDRKGEYTEYSIPFKKDVAPQVITYLKSLGK